MVPFSVAGAIIGKKGDALRQLKQETRCNMKMSRNEEGMYPGWAVFSVLRIQIIYPRHSRTGDVDEGPRAGCDAGNLHDHS
jgi:hypothetical protein